VLLHLAKGKVPRKKTRGGEAALRARLPCLEVVRCAQAVAATRDMTHRQHLQSRHAGGVQLARGNKDNGLGPKRNSDISELFKSFQICLELIRLKHGLSLL
jgi:hypothetical protein